MNDLIIKKIEVKDLSNDMLNKNLNIAIEIKEYIKQLETEALKRLERGEQLKSFSLAPTRPQKKWIDEQKTIDFLKNKVNELFDIKIKSPAEILKVVDINTKQELLLNHICEVSSNFKIKKEE